MNILQTFSAAAVLALATTLANAASVNFDDLSYGDIANGYAGLNWDNFASFDPLAAGFANTGYANGVVSGTHVAYNAGGNAASFSSATAFALSALDITAAWNSGLNVLIQGLVGGQVVDTFSVVIGYNAPTHLTFDWTELDQVIFTSSGGIGADLKPGYGGTHFALDNVTVTPSAVPLPAGSPLLLTALAGAIFLTRRRRT